MTFEMDPIQTLQIQHHMPIENIVDRHRLAMTQRGTGRSGLRRTTLNRVRGTLATRLTAFRGTLETTLTAFRGTYGNADAPHRQLRG
ncbi:MAG: hypothetical protein ACR2G2_09015 [Pseudonocardia sp.]